MDTIKYSTTLLVLSFSFILTAQETNTLPEQFDNIVNNSNSYQDFKVVKKTSLETLKRSVVDSISVYQQALAQMQSEIESQKIENNLLQTNLSEKNTKLEESLDKQNGISFLGILLTKGLYNAIVWTIIILLTLLLLLFVSRFMSSNKVTSSLQLKLKDTEDEFESHRQRAIDREQQLNRRLLDEVNKHK
jgi:predicted Holliday junction resolvase-like endonuclease